MSNFNYLYSFTGLTGTSYAPPVVDAFGNLIFTTATSGTGTVFSLDPNGPSSPTALFSFTNLTYSIGTSPIGGLLIDANGNLIGPASQRGPSYGSIYIIPAGPGGNYIHVASRIASFDHATTGGNPATALIADSSGDLFGVTSTGGAYGYGTVYEISSGGGLQSLGDLASPSLGSLVIDGAGNLWGTTYGNAGYNGQGTIFELRFNAGTNTYDAPTTAYSFDGSNLTNPTAGLAIDSSGDLFGTTRYGGAFGFGAVFEIPYPTGGAISAPVILASFNSDATGNPAGKLLIDGKGDIFGTTDGGYGTSGGIAYEIPYASGSYGALVTIATFAGDNPTGLVADKAGILYGTTSSGGANGRGGVFQINGARALDGPIAGATIFADTNNNFVLDPGEASTVTDANGRFTPPAGGPLVLQGGTDTSTNLPFTGQLSAPAGANVITSLTTLVQALLASGAVPTEAAAEQAVTAALGLTLPGTATLDRYDPLAGTQAGTPEAPAIYAAGAAVMDTIILAGAALAALDTGQTQAGAQAALVAALAAAIAANPASPIDLTDTATLASLVQAATRPGATAPDATQAAQIAMLISASNAKLTQAIAAGTPDAIARFVAQVEYVAQGETAPSLQPGSDLATVVANYTGAALDTAVANAAANVTCFYRGTSIATPTGEAAVETLAIGDTILTASGETRPILWIGRHTVSTRFGDPLRTLPIRITKGALGDNLPARDLRVSPRHAVLIDDILVEAAALVNGTTINRDSNVPEIFTYYHIELEDHALILAEGQPAETFVDNASRENFDNWEEHQALFPNGHPVPELDLPRAQSARQLPRTLRRRLGFDQSRHAA